MEAPLHERFEGNNDDQRADRAEPQTGVASTPPPSETRSWHVNANKTRSPHDELLQEWIPVPLIMNTCRTKAVPRQGSHEKHAGSSPRRREGSSVACGIYPP